jgi:N-acetylgalactosamine-N,N'-diacetylbacillosaminyl-diphospho-undecaprenol 4-alpha-N-acetylgalactosaminyltransferase
MTKRRVLFAINSLEGGGAERVMSRLLTHSDRELAEHEVHLALLDKARAKYPVPEAVVVHQLDCGGSLARSVLGLTRLALRLRPCVTLSFLTRANLANVVASAAARRPCLIAERINPSEFHKSGVRGAVVRLLMRALYPRATKVLAVSQGIADDLAANFGVPQARLGVIYNGIDLAAARASAGGPAPGVEAPYLLAVGRFTPTKNFDLLLRAFGKLDPRSRPRLLILGEGPERPALEALVADLGLASEVSMPGFVDNPFPYMGGAWALVLSSRAEGFPNVLIEAMAVGCPIVASDCESGPAEILRRGPTAVRAAGEVRQAVDGLMTPPNDEAALHLALEQICRPEVRARYAAAAPRRAGDFDFETTRQAYWREIEAVGFAG